MFHISDMPFDLLLIVQYFKHFQTFDTSDIKESFNLQCSF